MLFLPEVEAAFSEPSEGPRGEGPPLDDVEDATSISGGGGARTRHCPISKILCGEAIINRLNVEAVIGWGDRRTQWIAAVIAWKPERRSPGSRAGDRLEAEAPMQKMGVLLFFSGTSRREVQEHLSPELAENYYGTSSGTHFGYIHKPEVEAAFNEPPEGLRGEGPPSDDVEDATSISGRGRGLEPDIAQFPNWRGAYLRYTFNRLFARARGPGTSITGAGRNLLRNKFWEYGFTKDALPAHFGYIHKPEVEAALNEPPEGPRGEGPPLDDVEDATSISGRGGARTRHCPISKILCGEAIINRLNVEAVIGWGDRCTQWIAAVIAWKPERRSPGSRAGDRLEAEAPMQKMGVLLFFSGTSRREVQEHLAVECAAELGRNKFWEYGFTKDVLPARSQTAFNEPPEGLRGEGPPSDDVEDATSISGRGRGLEPDIAQFPNWRGAYLRYTFNRLFARARGPGTSITGAGRNLLRNKFWEYGFTKDALPGMLNGS
ncbi:hypothetical protein GN958_ATG19666 [Phytophthora infestans]|uniref:Uncharacterized protein n=1 Tax=Phytophthora infestans TaxID=4787 RepID=A0A8S9TRH0_PHYIN|nr:hypothetical protein GN958_ATG19666 [Phytophthora infestans]